MDPRLNVFRDDLADERLKGRIDARRFVRGKLRRVIAGLAPVRRAPEPDAPLDTFYQYGDRVHVFDEGHGYSWCQSEVDGYVGYVASEHVGDASLPAPVGFVATTGSYRYAEPDLRSSVIDFLPRHSAVVAVETGLMTRGTEYARLDTGGFLPFACISRQPPRSPDLVSAAEFYLGCPYLWGGRSFLGIDCSGLVQNAFREIGLTVLRDTDMQRDTIGEPVALSGIADLRRGDLLYMPGHVLIFAGDGMVLHADGATMTVRREPLKRLMQARGLTYSAFTVRRHPAASAG